MNMLADTRREEDVLNLLEQLKPYVRPEGQGVYRRLEREFAEFTTEVSTMKMVGADLGAADKWQRLGLTARQGCVAAALERAGERGMSRDAVLSVINAGRHEDDWSVSAKVVDVCIMNLRNALAGKGYWVETLYGRGYRLHCGSLPKVPTDAAGHRLWHAIGAGHNAAAGGY